MIALIAAVAKNNVIGSKNDMPWYLPEDLKRFKQLTTGHTVIMGRKTYESILARLGKPLPHRTNIVLTENAAYHAYPGVEIFNSLRQALEAHQGDEKIFIIGGASVFAEALPLADMLHITHIDTEYPGDVFFPKVDWGKWSKTFEEKHDGFSFCDYKKIVKLA